MHKTKFNHGWDFWKDGQESKKRRIDLPHDAMLEEKRQPDLPKGNATGFFPGGKYIYSKVIPGGTFQTGETVILEFEGVYMDAKVLLNGEQVGGWVYGYTNFYVDLSDKLEREKDNILAVIADNSKTPNSRWYSGSGIYRSVNLYTAGREYIVPDGIKVRTVSYAPAVVEVSVESKCDIATSVEIEVLENESIVAEGKGSPVTLTIPNATLWSAEAPNLYTVRVRLTHGSKVLDTAEIKTGIRLLSWDAANGLQVNGKTIKLRGGCVHHDHGPLGACSFDRAELRRVKTLKQLGYNAIRYSHNPAGRNFLEICDEVGMYVLDETFDQWRLPQSDHDYAIHFDSEWERM